MPRSRRAAPMAPADRRAAIIEATIPLLRSRGWMVTTREIAVAAGIAEGTIFSVFDDKEALLVAALEAAVNPAPIAERLAQIDPALPLADQLFMAVEILYEKMLASSQLVATIQLDEVRKRLATPTSGDYFAHGALAAIFEPYRGQLRLEPRVAGQAVVALTMAGSNPKLFGTPLTAAEIVTLLLGILGPAPELPAEPSLPGARAPGGA